MVAGIGILLGVFFVLIAIKIGFYEIFTFFFNAVMSVYLGIFLGPVIAATDMGDRLLYANSTWMLIVAVTTFLVLFAISYFLFTSQFKIPFPRVFDTVIAGAFGFLTGFLIWSFVSVLVWVMPVSQDGILARFGFSKYFQQTNVSYICKCCDIIHSIVSSSSNEQTTEELLDNLLKVEEKSSAKEKTQTVEQSNKELVFSLFKNEVFYLLAWQIKGSEGNSRRTP